MNKKNSMYKKILIAILLISLFILIDQISKYIVIHYLTSDIVLINDFLSIKFVTNTGVAFGINSGNNKANIIASIIVLILIARFLITKKDMITSYVKILLFLIISGGIGNIIDRFVYGNVIDFIKLGVIPVFNLADLYIVIGWILFIISLIKYAFAKENKNNNENIKR